MCRDFGVSSVERLSKHITTLLWIMLLALQAPAQILIPRADEVEFPDPGFDTGFVRKNRIRAVHAFVSLKPDNKPIEDEGVVRYYEFDTTGNLTKYFYTLVKTSQEKEIYNPPEYRNGRRISKGYISTRMCYTYDTLYSIFLYNEKNQLLAKRSGQHNIFLSRYYDYDEKGILNKELYVKETNATGNISDFKPGVQNIISFEKFTYEPVSASLVKKQYLNDDGKTYKQAFISYDDKGNKTEERYEFIVSWVKIAYTYRYDEKGRITEKKYSSNAGGELAEQTQYGYDPDGNLLTRSFFRNGKQLTERSFLYDENARLLKSQVERNFEKKNIEIVKYNYEFYGQAQDSTLQPNLLPAKSFK